MKRLFAILLFLMMVIVLTLPDSQDVLGQQIDMLLFRAGKHEKLTDPASVLSSVSRFDQDHFKLDRLIRLSQFT